MTRTTAILLLVLPIVLATSAAFAQNPAHLWSRAFGAAGNDYGNGVAADADGNVYVTGFFANSVNFGGTTLVSAGGFDIFLVKYSPSGVHQWSLRFGSTGDDRGQSVAIDANGRVAIAGQFSATVNFGGGNLVSAGGTDAFVAVYDGFGVHQWSRGFGSTGSENGYDVVANGTGVYLVGYFSGTVDFGGGGLASAGGLDVFVAKYTSAGSYQWSMRFGSTSTDYGLAIALDASANVFVAGAFTGTVSFGGGSLVSNGNLDTFLASYDTNGAHRWSRSAGGTSSDYGYGLAVDGSGNVVASGPFTGTANFGGAGLVSAGSNDIFLARYDNSGNHLWSQRFGAGGPDYSYGVAVEPSGSIALTGYFELSVDFGTGLITSGGFSDIFIARYDAAGTAIYARGFPTTDFDQGRSVAFDPSGNVFMTGYFDDTVDFGGDTFTTGGEEDVFLAKFSGGPAEPAIQAIDDIGNDQGRQVKITFVRSGGDDVTASDPIVRYEAYRRSDAPPATAPSGALTGLGRRELMSQGWTEVGSIHAHGESEYSIDVPTIGDSTVAAGQYYSAFYIRAAADAPATYYDSPADSGYSLDNLAPGAPQNFAFAAGELTWDESAAADFDYFTVYGSNTDSFGAATVVDYAVNPTLDVNASPYTFYFVTATDFSGNEGKAARVNTLSSVGGTPERYVLSLSSYPNPFNPRTTVSYTVPSRATVSVMIYDARGARIATLVDNEERAAGAYRVEWDGRAENGVTAASGVYFARIEHNGEARNRKMVLLK